MKMVILIAWVMVQSSEGLEDKYHSKKKDHNENWPFKFDLKRAPVKSAKSLVQRSFFPSTDNSDNKIGRRWKSKRDLGDGNIKNGYELTQVLDFPPINEDQDSIEIPNNNTNSEMEIIMYPDYSVDENNLNSIKKIAVKKKDESSPLLNIITIPQNDKFIPKLLINKGRSKNNSKHLIAIVNKVRAKTIDKDTGDVTIPAADRQKGNRHKQEKLLDYTALPNTTPSSVDMNVNRIPVRTKPTPKETTELPDLNVLRKEILKKNLITFLTDLLKSNISEKVEKTKPLIVASHNGNLNGHSDMNKLTIPEDSLVFQDILELLHDANSSQSTNFNKPSQRKSEQFLMPFYLADLDSLEITSSAPVSSNVAAEMTSNELEYEENSTDLTLPTTCSPPENGFQCSSSKEEEPNEFGKNQNLITPFYCCCHPCPFCHNNNNNRWRYKPHGKKIETLRQGQTNTMSKVHATTTTISTTTKTATTINIFPKENSHNRTKITNSESYYKIKDLPFYYTYNKVLSTTTEESEYYEDEDIAVASVTPENESLHSTEKNIFEETEEDIFSGVKILSEVQPKQKDGMKPTQKNKAQPPKPVTPKNKPVYPSKPERISLIYYPEDPELTQNSFNDFQNADNRKNLIDRAYNILSPTSANKQINKNIDPAAAKETNYKCKSIDRRGWFPSNRIKINSIYQALFGKNQNSGQMNRDLALAKNLKMAKDLNYKTVTPLPRIEDIEDESILQFVNTNGEKLRLLRSN